MTTSVLVTGATGALGPAVVNYLAATGAAVRIVTRRPLAAPPFAQPVETIVGDLADPGVLSRAVADVEAVCHLAALLHLPDPPPALQAEYQRVNVDLTQALVAAAQQAGVRRLVFFSTIAVYGPTQGGGLTDETTAPRPDSLYAHTKLAAEQSVLRAARADGQPLGVVLRLAAVYGPRVKGNYARLVRALARGRFIALGDGRNRRTLVYDEDVARAAGLALNHPAAGGRVYNVTDGEVHTLQSILVAISAALGRRTPGLAVPIAPARWAAGLVEGAAHRLGFTPPIRRATLDKYLEDTAVSGRLMQERLGFTPAYDLERGWRAAIQGMRQDRTL